MSARGKKLSGWDRKKASKDRQEKIKVLLEKVPKLDSFFKQPNQIDVSDYEKQEFDQPSTSAISVTNTSSQVKTTNPNINFELKISAVDEENAAAAELSGATTEKFVSSYQLTNSLIKDPAKWKIDDSVIDYIIKNPFVQIISKMDFEKSKRVYGTQSRYASRNIFFKKLYNGETIARKWLLYSPTTCNVYCLYCKLFSSNEKVNLFVHGFNDWKNINRISEHENSLEHCENAKKYIKRSNTLGKIDTNLHQLYLTEKEYWINVLKRIVAVIKFLTSRDLALRGTTDIFGASNNGNYLGALELLAEFDPFLKTHIEAKGNPGKGHVSYLSSTVCNEFIKLMAIAVREHISSEIESTKYFSIVIDSTPDISHTDQLTFVVRYVLENGCPVERFVTFVSKVGHKAVNMEAAVLKVLENMFLDLQNCRGQAYDNASNMSGKYSGLQARILEKNKLAKFVPCAAHSLNLVGTCAAECCSAATDFFMFVEEIYVFFSATTYRWEIMKECLTKNKTSHGPEQLVPKKLSATRWSARCDATTALFNSYEAFKTAIHIILHDNMQTPKTKAEAKGIMQKMSNLETGIMLSFWKDILVQFNKTSKFLQKQNMDILTAIQLYESLINFIVDLRQNFDKYEDSGRTLTNCAVYKLDNKRIKKRKLLSGETDAGDTTFSGKKDMEINAYYTITDSIITELKRRKSAYAENVECFGFLSKLLTTNDQIINEKCAKLQNIYANDLDINFANECLQFKYFINELDLQESEETDSKMKTWLHIIRSKDLLCTFPNMDIVLRMYLCLPVTNCTAERSFSTLKRVKTYLRSSLSDDKTADLSILSIESEIVKTLEFEELIKNFASLKCRKVNI